MVMGIITALIVVFSQVFFIPATNYSKKETKTDREQKQKSTDESYVSLPSVSQPSPSIHVEVIQKSCFLFEILFEKGEEAEETVNFPLSLGKFFHTLFRVIISPNAP